MDIFVMSELDAGGVAVSRALVDLIADPQLGGFTCLWARTNLQTHE